MASMYVGVCRLTFALPGNRSLKGKRQVVRRVVDRTLARFDAAVAEVARLDAHQQAVIGISVVSNEAHHANQMLDKIADFAGGANATGGDAYVMDRYTEVVAIGAGLDGPADVTSGSIDDFLSGGSGGFVSMAEHEARRDRREQESDDAEG